MFDTADKAAAISNKSNVYFAAGTYVITSPLYIRNGINLYGNTGDGRTVFSGDLDGNGPDDGDLSCFFTIQTTTAHNNTEKEVQIKNIDFDVLYFNQPEDGSTLMGAINVTNSGSIIVRNCNFTNTVNTGHGGNILFSNHSTVKFYDCNFTNNRATFRGVIARLHSNNDGSRYKGYTTFEHCIFANNRATTTDKTLDCSMVYLHSGQELNFNYCVIRDNICGGKTAVIWNNYMPKDTEGSRYKRLLHLHNTLIYNNSSADNVMIQIHSNNTESTYTNSVIHDDATSAAINISSIGVGTYYLSLPFTMPAGVIGKTFSSITGSRLTEGTTYKAGNVVPAGTALLVEGSEGTYDPVVAESDDDAPANLLKGSDLNETTTGGAKYYKLANDTGLHGLGFYWGAANGAAFTNGAHKAYLALSGGTSARSFFSFFDNDVTAIDRIATTTLRKDGKFIENGRIVIMKNGVKYNTVGQKM